MRCFICKVQLCTFLDFTKHFKLFHLFDNVTEYKCVEPLCNRIFGSMNSYGKRLKSHFDTSTSSKVEEHNVMNSTEFDESNIYPNNNKTNLDQVTKNFLDKF